MMEPIKHSRNLGWWALAWVMLAGFQYVTVSNIYWDPEWPVGSYPYGRFAVIPLPRAVIPMVGKASYVTLLPLRPVVTHYLQTRAEWAGVVMKVVFPFRNYTASFVTFSLVNSSFWLLGGWALTSLRRLARRRRTAKEWMGSHSQQ